MKKLNVLALLVLSVALIAATIDLDNLFNYAAQTKPVYITKDNTPNNNAINDLGATLGRVLFYDKQLSANNTIACASCHHQQFAFSDTARLSVGLDGGLTGRHAMRLVNSRFGVEQKFFWDERAASLEAQTSRPIQDHVEMGFSNTNGDPDLDSLIRRLEAIDYYQRLFTLVYGNSDITEDKIQRALAQFVRSMQSFDSKYDVGRAQVNNDGQPFPNFTQQENQGKQIFLTPPPQGGAGCQGCHAAPEFDIDPNSLNNGVIANAQNNTLIDLTNTRAPSLRDLVNPNGTLNGPMMHNGNFTSLLAVINHYDSIVAPVANTNLDPRLRGPNQAPQNLQLTQVEKNALEAFLRTLTGSDIYTNEKWSNPFDAQGNITLLPELTVGLKDISINELNIYPNPASSFLNVDYAATQKETVALNLYSLNGSLIFSKKESSYVGKNHFMLDVQNFENGIYFLQIKTNSVEKNIRVVVSK